MIVVATPGLNVTIVAMATELQARSVQGDCDNMDELSMPPANFELFADEGFSINWCQFQVHIYHDKVVIVSVYLALMQVSNLYIL